MLDDIKETLEKEKVKLTPEVEEYIRSHLKVVQDKIADDKDIFEEDLAFIGKVKMWIFLPKDIREKYESIDEMEKSDKVQNAVHEANKRGLDVRRWLDLLHMAESAGKEQGWIDDTFTFEGGKIICEGDLKLRICTSLKSLPEGLHVGGILDLYNCESLTSLPKGLRVEKYLALEGCSKLQADKHEVLLYLWGKIKNDEIKSLSLNKWPLEDGDMPDNLHIKEALDLSHCTSLTALPDNLQADSILNLRGCTSLFSLPKNFTMGGFLDLEDCTELMKNKENALHCLWGGSNNRKMVGLSFLGWPLEDGDIPDNLLITSFLNLANCTSLTTLPNNLCTVQSLSIEDCTSLTSLPDSLSVGGVLCLSKNLTPQVQQDADRLQREGKVSTISYN